METNRKRELTPEEREECSRLNELYRRKKREGHRLPNGYALSQESLSGSLEISQGGLSHYLTGRNALNVDFAVKVAAALGVQISEFSTRLEAEARQFAAMAGGAAPTPKQSGGESRPAPSAPANESDEILKLVQDLLQAGKLTRANLVLAMMNSATTPTAHTERNGKTTLPPLKNTVSVQQLHNRQVLEENKNQLIEEQQQFVKKIKTPPKQKPADKDKKSR